MYATAIPHQAVSSSTKLRIMFNARNLATPCPESAAPLYALPYLVSSQPHHEHPGSDPLRDRSIGAKGRECRRGEDMRGKVIRQRMRRESEQGNQKRNVINRDIHASHRESDATGWRWRCSDDGSRILCLAVCHDGGCWDREGSRQQGVFDENIDREAKKGRLLEKKRLLKKKKKERLEMHGQFVFESKNIRKSHKPTCNLHSTCLSCFASASASASTSASASASASLYAAPRSSSSSASSSSCQPLLLPALAPHLAEPTSPSPSSWPPRASAPAPSEFESSSSPLLRQEDDSSRPFLITTFLNQQLLQQAATRLQSHIPTV